MKWFCSSVLTLTFFTLSQNLLAFQNISNEQNEMLDYILGWYDTLEFEVLVAKVIFLKTAKL